MDLSKLLGDLYTSDDDHAGNGHGDDDHAGDHHDATGKELASPPGALETSAGPDWSNETRLDQVFASWTPGPPSDAPAAEREMAYSGLPASTEGARLPAASDSEVEDGVTDVAVPAPATAETWTRSDDDVLPYRRSRGRSGRLSRLRR